MTAKAQTSPDSDGQTSEPGPSIESPSEENSGPEDQEYSFDDVARELDEGYDLNMEVVGDVHDTDLDQYKQALDSKYSSEEELDVVAVTGDWVDNNYIRNNGKEPDEPEEFYKSLLDNLSDANEIGESHDVDVLTVPGNHAPIKGAQPGNEEYVEEIEEWLAEHDENFAQSDKNVFEYAVDQFDNVKNIEYDTVDIGDTTIIGGSHFFNPEKDPGKVPEPELDDLYSEDELEEIADTLEDESKPEYKWADKVPIIGTAYKWVNENIFGNDGEDYDVEDIDLDTIEGLSEDLKESLMSEEHKEYKKDMEEEFEEYNEKYDSFNELFDQAQDNVVLLDHFTFDTGGKSDIDLLHEGKGTRGSPALRDVVKEYSEEKDITTFFGHKHSDSHDKVFGVDMYRIGEGSYMEVGLEDGTVRESYRYDPTEWGAEPVEGQRGQPRQQDQSEIDLLMQDIARAGGPDQFYDQLDEIDHIPDEAKSQLRQDRDRVESMWEEVSDEAEGKENQPSEDT